MYVYYTLYGPTIIAPVWESIGLHATFCEAQAKGIIKTFFPMLHEYIWKNTQLQKNMCRIECCMCQKKRGFYV